MLFPFTVKTTLSITDYPSSHENTTLSEEWMACWQSTWNDEVESAPISNRGWVVQERFLAPRVLHFTRNQIYWECLEAIHLATHPATDFSSLVDGIFRPIPPSCYKVARLELAKAGGDTCDSDPVRSLYHIHWGTVVSNYVACSLTKESDRFLAMAGIAKVFQEVNDDVYLAGVWKKTAHTDLGWTTEARSGVPARRSTELRAPSWSWASIVGGNVKFLRTYHGNLPFSTIKVLEVRGSTETEEDSVGLLNSPELEIECILFHYLWRGRDKSVTVFERGSQTVTNNINPSLALDTSELVERFDAAEEIRGLCVPINGHHIKYGGGGNQFLVLEHDSGQRYRRIGLMTGSAIGNDIRGLPEDNTSRITLI
jgi:hypothetical protein